MNDIYDPIGHSLGLEQSYLFSHSIEEEYKSHAKQYSLGVKDEKISKIISDLWKDPEYRKRQEAGNAGRSSAKKGKPFAFVSAEMKSAAATKANTTRWSNKSLETDCRK